MKKFLSIFSLMFCVSIFCFGQGVNDRPIDGYVVINDNHCDDLFMADDPRVDWTEIGVKAGVPFRIYITKPSSGIITWETLSNSTGAYMALNTNDGHLVSFVTTSANGVLVLRATDSSGNQLTFNIYITDGGVS